MVRKTLIATLSALLLGLYGCAMDNGIYDEQGPVEDDGGGLLEQDGGPIEENGRTE